MKTVRLALYLAFTALEIAMLLSCGQIGYQRSDEETVEVQTKSDLDKNTETDTETDTDTKADKDIDEGVDDTEEEIRLALSNSLSGAMLYWNYRGSLASPNVTPSNPSRQTQP